MKYMRYVALLALLALPLAFAQAEVRVGVGIGVGPGYVAAAPVCAYGYYPDYPYACAPSGYYGPEWFSGGVFIGAGPWYHGWGHGYYGGWGHGYYGHDGRGFVAGRYAGRGFEGRGTGGRVESHGTIARSNGFHGGGFRGRR
jgi:hypothetical protein